MTAIDSSVCVAALLEWHSFHADCAEVARDATIPTHALLETYSVLTRLPAPHRLDAGFAAELLRQRFPSDKRLPISAKLQRSCVDRLASLNISGGGVYDALIALTAAANGETLATCDTRALPVYTRLDVGIHVVPVGS